MRAGLRRALRTGRLTQLSQPSVDTEDMTSTPLVYVDCDVPEGMTLDEYRRRKVRPVRRGLRSRLRDRSGPEAPARGRRSGARRR